MLGVRFSDLISGLFVDLRLKDYASPEHIYRDPIDHKVKRAEFTPAQGIKVIYETKMNQVKETIELSGSGPSEFRYRLSSPGMKLVQMDDAIVFDSPLYKGLFRLDGLKVWDAAGKVIPASLSLEGREAVVRLDPESLAKAQTPITIDPVISGQTGIGPQGRKLFETSEGRLVLFHLVNLSNGWHLAYSVSSAGGDTWSEPILIGPTPGTFGAAAQMAPDDTFYLTYAAGPAGSTFVGFRRLTPLSDGTWSVGPETSVATGEITLFPRPSISDLGDGTAGRRLAIGFVSDNALGSSEYLVAFSENSGDSWGTASKCADAGRGTLAAQGDRLFCITPGASQHLEVREWLNLAWSLPVTIPVGVFVSCDSAVMPSTVKTDDGRLHLVMSASPTGTCDGVRTQYSYLSPGSSEWTAPAILGLGVRPVISTNGTSLHVFTQRTVAFQERRIHSYVNTDGTSWAETPPLLGTTFTHVIDENELWSFRDSFNSGDALFSLSDTSGEWGNRIGNSSTLNKLDDPEKKISFSFVEASGGTASSITVWITANNSPTYRIGIQSDCSALDLTCQGFPSGTWLVDSTLSGSWGEVVPANSTVPAPLAINLGSAASLSAGIRYHVVIQPVQDPTGINIPSSSNWMAPQTVGADTGAEGSNKGTYPIRKYLESRDRRSSSHPCIKLQH